MDMVHSKFKCVEYGTVHQGDDFEKEGSEAQLLDAFEAVNFGTPNSLRLTYRNHNVVGHQVDIPEVAHAKEGHKDAATNHACTTGTLSIQLIMHSSSRGMAAERNSILSNRVCHPAPVILLSIDNTWISRPGGSTCIHALPQMLSPGTLKTEILVSLQ